LRMAAALDRILIGGVTTNTGFHRWLIDQPAVVNGRVTTRFLDEVDLPPAPDEAVAAVAAAELWAGVPSSSTDPWRGVGTFRIVPHRPVRTIHVRGHATHDVDVTGRTVVHPAVVDVAGRRVVVSVEGYSHTFRVLTRSERWAPAT